MACSAQPRSYLHDARSCRGRAQQQVSDAGLSQVLCALISPDPINQRWLHLAGMVPLLQRLTLQRSLDTLGDGNLPSLLAEPSALGLQRQSARMLAMLASDTAAQPAISRSAWVRPLPCCTRLLPEPARGLWMIHIQ